MVKSTDSGATWTPVTTIASGTIADVAYDQQRSRLYIVDGAGRKLYQWENSVLADITSSLPSVNNSAQGANTVAVDPVDPNVLYVGKEADIYCSSAGVVCSTNAGTNWTVLTKQIASSGPDGGREASCIRVHPVSRYAYVAGACYGFWKIAPPGSGQLPVQVRLNIVPAANTVTLFWPTNVGTNIALQQKSNLTAVSWSAVTNVPTRSGTNFSLTQPATKTKLFFRLGL